MIYTNTIGQKDRQVIEALIAETPGASFGYFVTRLHKIFKNITPNHYVVLGYMIGYTRGTVEVYEEILNNNSPCQRAN